VERLAVDAEGRSGLPPGVPSGPTLGPSDRSLTEADAPKG